MSGGIQASCALENVGRLCCSGRGEPRQWLHQVARAERLAMKTVWEGLLLTGIAAT